MINHAELDNEHKTGLVEHVIKSINNGNIENLRAVQGNYTLYTDNGGDFKQLNLIFKSV